MDRKEQEKRFSNMCRKSPAWKKEVLLLELFYRASQEDRDFAIGYLDGKEKIFKTL